MRHGSTPKKGKVALPGLVGVTCDEGRVDTGHAGHAIQAETLETPQLKHTAGVPCTYNTNNTLILGKYQPSTIGYSGAKLQPPLLYLPTQGDIIDPGSGR